MFDGWVFHHEIAAVRGTFFPRQFGRFSVESVNSRLVKFIMQYQDIFGCHSLSPKYQTKTSLCGRLYDGGMQEISGIPWGSIPSQAHSERLKRDRR